MPITTYLPTKLSTEANRFKTNSGNVKLDYRSATGSAPYLFSIPFVENKLNTSVDIIPAQVPTEPHVTGDSTNYRRYTTEIGVSSNDYQRNVTFLHLNGNLYEVVYVNSVYVEYEFEGDFVKELEHNFTFVDQTINPVSLGAITPLILEATEVERGLVDQQFVVELKLDTTLNLVYSTYSSDINGLKGVVITEESAVDYGESDTVVDSSLINPKITGLKHITARDELYIDDSFKTNLIYASNFSRAGSSFTTENVNVLTDTYPNFYLYSKSLNLSQDVVGYTLNVSPTRGSLLTLINSSDSRDYIYNAIDYVVGKSQTYYGTEYTGLLSSPFVLLKVDLTSDLDTFKLKIGDDPEIVLGDYSTSNFNHLCAKLSEILYPLGILVIPCKDFCIGFDRFSGVGKIELTLTSNTTTVTTIPKFDYIEYLTTTKQVPFDLQTHPVNLTFTYVDEIDPEVPSTYPIVYKMNIGEDTSRITSYVTYKTRLKFDIQSARSTSQPFKIDIDEGVLDTTLVISGTDTIEAVIDYISSTIVGFLPASYSVEKSYITSSIDIINNDTDASKYVSITTGTWAQISNLYGGVYVENLDTSRSFVMKKNDGSSTITTDNGIVAFDCSSDYLDKFGRTNYNPVTGAFSSVSVSTSSSLYGTYCYVIQELNKVYRQYGYEVRPLYTAETGDPSSYLGIAKIVNSSVNTKPVVIASPRALAYENLLYKASKDMYHTSDNTGVRVQLLKGNESIFQWKDIVLAGNADARPFEIKEYTPTIYARTVNGILADKDNMVITSIRPGSASSSLSNYHQRTFNITTGDPVVISSDLLLTLSELSETPSLTSSQVGDVYTTEGNGYKVDYNSVTKQFTFSTTLETTICTGIGLDVDLDLTITNYAGWSKCPRGLNTSSDKYNLLESKPHIYMLIMAYNSTIDGV